MPDQQDNSTTQVAEIPNLFTGNLPISEALTQLRLRLLDLTSRNRLLNFKPSSTKSLQVVEAVPDVIFQRLLDNRSLAFAPVPDPAQSEYIVREGRRVKPDVREYARQRGITTDFELSAQAERRAVTQLRALYYPEDLERQCRRIAREARSVTEETGTNMLYLVLGLLEFYESDDSERPLNAPLIAIPVDLKRGRIDADTRLYRYELSYSGDEISENLSLREKLKQEFGIQLPELAEDDGPESYFTKIRSAIRRKLRWKVKRQMTLGLLSFAKMMLVQDIDPKNWPRGKQGSPLLEHPIVRRIFEGGGSESGDRPGDYEIDEHLENGLSVIYDADTSQHSALIDALAGKNMVVNGPPGTGKSQTITNLIAATIQRGKRVLFVSEKLAALEVVRHRLEQAGLGEFCLELHSHKTNKKRVLEDLSKRNSAHYAAPRFLRDRLASAEDRRKQLKAYADVVNSVLGNELGLTVFEILWRAEHHRQKIGPLAVRLEGIVIDEVGQILPEQLDQMRSLVSALGHHFKEIGSFGPEYPWYGFFPSTLNPGDDLAIHNLLAKFDDGLSRLGVAVDELRGKSCEPISAEFDALQDFAAKVEILPSPSPQVIPGLLSRFFTALDPNARGGKAEVSQLKSLCDHASAMARIAAGKLHHLDRITKESIGAAKTESQKLRSWQLGGQSIDALRTHVSWLQKAVLSLREALVYYEDCSSICELQFYGTEQSILRLHEIIKIAHEAPHDLLEYRRCELGHPNASEVCTRACAHRASVEGQRQGLESILYLDEAFEAGELQRSIRTLRRGYGWYRFLIKDWRHARRFHRSLSKDKRGKSSETRLGELTALAEYMANQESFVENKEYSGTFGKLFQGIDTDFTKVERLVDWYARSHEVLIRQGIGPDNFDLTGKNGFHMAQLGLRYADAQAVGQRMREEADKLCCFLRETHCTHSALDEKEPWGTRLEAISAFIRELEKAIDIFTDIGPATLSSDELVEALNAQGEYTAALEKIQSHHTAKQLLAGHFEGIETDFSGIFETIAWGQQIVDVCLPDRTTQMLLLPDARANLCSLKVATENAKCASECIREFICRMHDLGPFDWEKWISHAPRKDDGNSIENYRSRAAVALNNLDCLLPWTQYIDARERMSHLGLNKFAEKLEAGEFEPDNLVAAFLYRFYSSIGTSIFRSRPVLGRFSSKSHERIREEFAQLDKDVISLRGRQCASESAEMADPPRGQSSPRVEEKTEMELLWHLFSLQKPRTSIRKMIRRAGRAIQELKPCFMMGPLSVAQYLEPGAVQFDLVVMDEASQLKPEEAIGAIARGGQLIVVGDQKQLPPTTFFDRITTSDDEEDEGFAVSASESILDICRPLFTSRTLKWHYRSKHESLIAFSNHHFYDGQLIVFPSPYPKTKRLGLRYHHISNGIYQNRQNVVEARRVVDAIFDHIANHPDESLGVVTLNITQRDLIEEILEKRLKEFEDGEKYRARWEKEGWPLFVKNLENVQGDERDVIFISTTFGKAPGTNVVRQNFGPISRPTGWRRLNVLFTRARKSLHVFSSMQSEDIISDAGTPEGTKALKNYLAYAARGILATGEFTAREPDSDFEISVANVLRIKGYEIQPQLGVAGFFIDIAVRHPKRLGEFMAAVECDGASYHSGVSVRDRDRIRQEILESLGWKGKIWRIWSADWFRNPQRETQRMLSFLNERLTLAEQEPPLHEEYPVAEVRTEPYAHKIPSEQLQLEIQDVDEDEDLFVEVGDSVTYCSANEPKKRVVVRITDGPSNFTVGYVNEETPLAQAFLGAYEGEEVKFVKPSGESIMLRVQKIERNRAGTSPHH